jgi:tRNA1(Val) A37 N6-methylase TrmN6
VFLAAAVRRPQARFWGLERDSEALELARRNIALNGLEDRAQALAWEVERGFSGLGLQPFDAVLCNPPFFDEPSRLRAPHPKRAGAYLAEAGLKAWTDFLLKATREGGSITVVHRADRLGDLLALLSPKAGSFRIRSVHPFADAPAKRVLLRAVKTGKAPLQLLPPLVLHDRAGAKHTPEAEAILRGEAALGWG